MDFSAPGALIDWFNLVTTPAEIVEVGVLSGLGILFFMWIVWNGADLIEWGIDQLYKAVDFIKPK